jgi:hypothetical protein
MFHVLMLWAVLASCHVDLMCLHCLQDEMAKLAEQEGTSSSSGSAKAKLNNVLMQMRKNCNHPDLITSAFTADLDYPSPEVRHFSCDHIVETVSLLVLLLACHAGLHLLLFSCCMPAALECLPPEVMQQDCPAAGQQCHMCSLRLDLCCQPAASADYLVHHHCWHVLNSVAVF